MGGTGGGDPVHHLTRSLTSCHDPRRLQAREVPPSNFESRERVELWARNIQP